MLIGLHKMAAERGDGLIPEMLDVLRRSREARADGFDESADLVQFSGREAEPGIAAHPASNENNVIAFPIAKRRVMRR
ncbi:MAG: hypothetical protein KL863_21335 [Rhizobium sp.]|nr:hypothetical protein [Rhizobium sp.]